MIDLLAWLYGPQGYLAGRTFSRDEREYRRKEEEQRLNLISSQYHDRSVRLVLWTWSSFLPAFKHSKFAVKRRSCGMAYVRRYLIDEGKLKAKVGDIGWLDWMVEGLDIRWMVGQDEVSYCVVI